MNTISATDGSTGAHRPNQVAPVRGTRARAAVVVGARPSGLPATPRPDRRERFAYDARRWTRRPISGWPAWRVLDEDVVEPQAPFVVRLLGGLVPGHDGAGIGAARRSHWCGGCRLIMSPRSPVAAPADSHGLSAARRGLDDRDHGSADGWPIVVWPRPCCVEDGSPTAMTSTWDMRRRPQLGDSVMAWGRARGRQRGRGSDR